VHSDRISDFFLPYHQHNSITMSFPIFTRFLSILTYHTPFLRSYIANNSPYFLTSRALMHSAVIHAPIIRSLFPSLFCPNKNFLFKEKAGRAHLDDEPLPASALQCVNFSFSFSDFLPEKFIQLFNGYNALVTDSVDAQYVYGCLSGFLRGDLSGVVVDRRDPAVC